jgi:hypothetical protein
MGIKSRGIILIILIAEELKGIFREDKLEFAINIANSFIYKINNTENVLGNMQYK